MEPLEAVVAEVALAIQVALLPVLIQEVLEALVFKARHSLRHLAVPVPEVRLVPATTLVVAEVADGLVQEVQAVTVAELLELETILPETLEQLILAVVAVESVEVVQILLVVKAAPALSS
jgi:hypothetical protein